MVQLARVGQLMGPGKKAGASAPPVTSKPWYPDGIYYTDDAENSRYYNNGASQASAPSYPFSVSLGSECTVRVVATAGPNQAASAYAVAIDNDVTDGLQEAILMGKTTAGAGSMSVRHLNANVAASLATVPTTWADTIRRQVMLSVKQDDYAAAAVGVNNAVDTSGIYPSGLTLLRKGNTRDGTKPWTGGTVHRIDIWKSKTPTPAGELVANAAVNPASFSEIAYSWWANSTECRGNWTYHNGMDNTGTNQVCERVHNITGAKESFILHTGRTKDDHDNGGLGFLSDGRLVVVYGGHSEVGGHFRVSTDDSPLNLGAEQAIPTVTGVTDGNNSYFQLEISSTDRLVFVFQGALDGQWNCFYCDGPNYTSANVAQGKRLFFNAVPGPTVNQWYMKCAIVSGDLRRYYGHSHPSNAQNVIWTFDFNILTGDIIVSGVTIGNAYSGSGGSGIFSELTAETVRTPPSGKSQRLMGIRPGGDAFVFVRDFDNAALSAGGMYCLAIKESGVWSFRDIAASGAAVYSNYYRGCDFDRSIAGIGVFTVEESSGTSIARYYTTSDNGQNWSAAVEMARTTQRVLFRPISPRNASPLAPVDIMTGVYTDFNVWTLWATFGLRIVSAG